MNPSSKRISTILTSLYTIIVALSALPLVLPGSGSLSGVYLTLITQPWSTIGVITLDAINPELLDSGMGIVVTFIGALLNGCIIYFGSRWLANSMSKEA